MSFVRTVVGGLILATIAAATVLVGDALDLSLASAALLGLSAGAVLGLLVGFGGYALTAALLPDTVVGQAVGIALTLVLAALTVALTFGRLPLWSTLLGVSVFAGAFQASFAASPGSILTEGPIALTTVVLTTAIGFATTTLITATTPRPASAPSPSDADEMSADDIQDDIDRLINNAKERV